jgi:hypothetical protein
MLYSWTRLAYLFGREARRDQQAVACITAKSRVTTAGVVLRSLTHVTERRRQRPG